MRNLALLVTLLTAHCSEWTPPNYAALTTAEIFAIPGAQLVSPQGEYQPIYPRKSGRLCKASSFLRQRKLGEGGSGEVWSAIYKPTRIMVAIKYIRLGEQPEFWAEEARNEEQILRIASHPNIPKLHCTFVQGKIVGIAMQYVDALSLGHWLCKTSNLSQKALQKHIMRELINVLTYLHGLGIIHRDVKLLNVLMSKSCGIYLIDYGHAIYAPSGVSGFCGTDGHRAPEMLKDQIYDGRVDWFSLGVCLYMINGRRAPYAGEGTLEQLLAGREELEDKQAEDLINHLCDLDPETRWSWQNNNIENILEHPFLLATKLKD
jgi:serine/threonine protein kinase